MRAVIYTRISADDGRALGVTRQEQDCRGLCEARGWVVADVIVDNDVSAYSGKRRPGYESLLVGLRERRWDVLVVWHPDRLHRRPVELEEFIDIVESSAVQVSTVTAGEIDLSTPDGRLLARIVGSVARKESEDKSRRLRRKHLELAEAGAFAGGGLRPFGYEADGVTLRPSEADEIRAAAGRVLAGASLRSIAVDWNKRVPSVSGALWDHARVKKILCSPRIAGLREHRGEIVGPAKWPAIIDADDHARVKAILTRPGPVAVRSYLLTGWVYCACGTRMTTRPAQGRRKPIRRYACVLERGGCGRCGIAAEPLDALVSRQVRDHLARKPLPAPAMPDRSELVGVEGRRRELAEMWAAGQIGRAEWDAARRSLEAREAALVVPVVFSGEVVWPDDLDGQRNVIATKVERVWIATTVRGANRFDPGRVSVDWL
jgi:site-specific DNA recombinase